MSIPFEYVYTPSTTDVTIRWRVKHKWQPPSEQEHYKKKWADFRAQSARGIESLEPHEDPLMDVTKDHKGRVLQWKNK
jgi:hypothetical protein